MKPIEKKTSKNQKGSATIEAIVAFSGFLFVIFTILNIANFCRAQMLISNAMDTVTKELTQYSYFYQVSGLQKFDQDIQAIGEEGALNLNTVAGSVGDLYSSLGTALETGEEELTGMQNSLLDGSITSESVSTALNNVKADGTDVLTSINQMEAQFANVADNPVLYLKSIVAVAGSEGLELVKSHALAAPLAKALMIKHFGGNKDEANAQLESLSVVGGLDAMNFGMSTIFTKEHPDEIHLVVYYKLKVMQLFEWADFEACICKETRARAWLGGDDVVVKAVTQATDPEETTPSTSESESGEEENSTAEQIKAQMIEKYGQDVVDAICAEQDTSTWTVDDWEYQVWLYQNSDVIEENVSDENVSGEEARNIMILIYGSDIVLQISAISDTSTWTVDDWLAAIWLYQYMEANQSTEESSSTYNSVDTGGLVVIETKTPETANAEWADRGYDNPPYDTNYEVKVVQAGSEEYVRVYSCNEDGTSNKLGGWLMKKSDVEGLTPAQIADKYALPTVPTHICDVEVASDYKLQTGIANGIDGWGSGGGQQFDTMGEYLPETAFVNERPLGE